MGKTKKNSIEITPLDKISNQQRIDVVVPYLINCIPKNQIIDILCKRWGCARCTVQAIINEALVWLTKNSIKEAEHVKAMNFERLDNLFGECKSVKDKIKIIDTQNRLWGLYETNVNVANKEDKQIKFNIGVDNGNNK